ncbi:hypothetical protein A1E_01865 [Rickettsia canadensis str. McKiel]|uniref:Uncharacterized protein n=1 Tax=Rickettsia canadensis (strain McKiel) TaxID=293613 RepID=A8EY85_RICCK|nr:hypothetical protein A1E_01865 [Rickettsia canadensis str. McKiel]
MPTIDLTLLGAMQSHKKAILPNWNYLPGKMVKDMEGAMDLATNNQKTSSNNGT